MHVALASSSLRARAFALGLAVTIAGFASAAWDEPGRGGAGQDFSGDPTVGTLPMRVGEVADVPGPDQVLYLTGDATALRAVLGHARFDWVPGAFAMGVWALPEGRAWVELHGEFDADWSDVRDLAAVEIGVGAGFEGGGLVCAVECAAGTTAPTLVEVGRSFEVSLPRLHDAGLLAEPIVLHGRHLSGQRTRLELEAAAGGLTIRQRL